MNRLTDSDRGDGLFGQVRQATEQAEEVVAAEAVATWTPTAFRSMNMVSAVAVLAFGAAICVGARSYPMWVGGLPGAGLFPGVIGGIITVLGVLYLVGSLRGVYRIGVETEPPPTRNALARSALSVAALVVAAFSLVPIGYPVVCAVGVTVLIRLGGGRLRVAALIGILFAAASFLLVTTVLGIQLPTGLLRPLLVGLL
ncbi:tripartite tricarboxylate transporter TctB family protein [Mycobacterium sp. NPDC003449]